MMFQARTSSMERRILSVLPIIALLGCSAGKTHALPAPPAARGEVCADQEGHPAKPIGIPRPSPVFVLATVHLDTQLAADPAEAGLHGVLDVLARLRPEMIAVEQLPGESIEDMERRSPADDAVLEAFAAGVRPIGSAAQQALGMSRSQAQAEADRLARDLAGRLADQRTSADHARAAMLFAAAYDLTSAALQWSYAVTGAAAGGSDPEVPRQVREPLAALLESRNERVAIGIALARRLGLQQVFPIDDQSDASFQIEFGERLMQELNDAGALAQLEQSTLMQELPRRIQRASADRDLLGLLRWLNSPAYAEADRSAEWAIFLDGRLASGLGRVRLALWERRNLLIAAKIRAVTARLPGACTLVIIGAAHKPFLDAYLRQMMDVEVVESPDVLGRE